MKHTQLPNELIEKLYKTRISGEEMQILHFIFRKTYGFNKKEDRIALSQFVEGTGIDKSNIIRAQKKLIDKNIVVKKDNVVNNDNIWCVNEEYHAWKPLSKKTTKIVVKNDNLPLSILTHTKDNTTKDNIYTHKILRKKSDTRIISDDNLKRLQEFIDSWNTTRGTKFKATEALHDNFSYWAAIYTQREMLDAIPKIKTDSFWDKIMTPEIFFRRRNPNRENVDHIGKFSNLQPVPIREGFMSYDELKAKGLSW